MPLQFVLDEHLRGPLWDVIKQHSIYGIDPIDVVRVGDLRDLPLGIKDPDCQTLAGAPVTPVCDGSSATARRCQASSSGDRL